MNPLFLKRALPFGAIAVVGLACGEQTRAKRGGLNSQESSNGSVGIVAGPCKTGVTQGCSITLSEHNGVLNCFHGEQVCVEGSWSECGDGSIVSLPSPGGFVAKGLRLKAVTGANDCQSNPCDPSCLELEREADAGTGSSVLLGDITDFQWQTGRLSDFPSGLVKKGLIEPCSSGSDCQFNTRCTYPVSGSCEHNKCSEGTALDSSCDPCVSDICDANPECCERPASDPPLCAHDPCKEGDSLLASCSGCVSDICEVDPSCCTDGWTAACTDAVVSVCGATCECGTSERSYGDSCYFKEEADLNWDGARANCQSRGSGWDLASVGNAGENYFIASRVIDNSNTWFGFTDGNGIGTEGNWTWATGEPAGTWNESTPRPGTSDLTPYSSTWKYLGTNTNPGTAWADLSFDDSGWPTGTARFGYNAGQTTFLSHGGASYYFRRSLNLANTPTAATLEIQYDDGFLAYVNGVEIGRGQVTNADHGSFATGFTNNALTASVAIDPALFRLGDNIVAVVVKNGSGNSFDMAFNAKLTATVPPAGQLYQNFRSDEPGGQDCGLYEKDRTGAWVDGKCWNKFDSVCEGPPKNMVSGPAAPSFGPWTALRKGSTWKYSDVDEGANWYTPEFDDSEWASGPSQLGFGDGDEDTLLAKTGPTYYFRSGFNLPSDISGAAMTLTYDDAFAVYVNGTLLEQRNMGLAAYSYYAVRSSQDNEKLSVPLETDAFVLGENTIAVMVKNRSSSSPDISFDLELNLTLCGPSGCPPEPTWTQSCVDDVSSVCGARCDSNDPPSSTGQCVSWGPGEVDASCSGVDLALGVPCDEVIPVCNHGTVAVPAGIRLIHYPANSGHYPSCEPDQGHPGIEECFTDTAIAPGECVDVTDCPGLIGNRELMVNPPGTDHVAECNCRDNWSLYNKGECGEPVCDSGSSVATLQSQPVDIVFVVDNSGSMGGEIRQVQKRINEDFARIIGESGIDYRVIMVARYGDVDISVSDSNFPVCVSSPLGGHDCSNPSHQPVTNNPGKFYHYSSDVGSHDALCDLLEGFTKPDELGTSSRPWTPLAPNGYQKFLRPEARKAFVAITDDRVNCTFNSERFDDLGTVTQGQDVATRFDARLLQLSPEQFGTVTDRNYVFHSIVGMKENTPGTEPWPSTAPVQVDRCSPGSVSPGTGYQALSALTGGLRYPSCRNDDFDAIFRALAEDVVEGAVASCSIVLDSQGSADTEKTSVSYVPGNGASTVDLTRVDNVGACAANSYYFEDATTVTLCPSTCAVVQADLSGSLGVEVGCEGGETFAPRVVTEQYASECNEDATVQWSFFTYNTTTPGDSNATFRIRSAETQAGLEAALYYDLAVATSSPEDTQICTLAGPSPCPIDLFSVLDANGLAHNQFMELEVVLNPTTAGDQPATIQTWELSYSCPFSQ